MDVKKIITSTNIKPTNRKVKQAKKTVKEILPKEMPIERPIYIKSAADIFDDVKNSIQIAVDYMRKN